MTMLSELCATGNASYRISYEGLYLNKAHNEMTQEDQTSTIFKLFEDSAHLV